MAMKLGELGRLYPGPKEVKQSVMFLRVAVTDEDATDDEGNAYELAINAGGSTPIVISRQTGRTFTLSWNDILSLAVSRGIDGTDVIPDPRKAKALAKTET